MLEKLKFNYVSHEMVVLVFHEFDFCENSVEILTDCSSIHLYHLEISSVAVIDN